MDDDVKKKISSRPARLISLSEIDESGLTVLELIIIVAIMGLLAVGVFAQAGSARAKARDTKRIVELHELQDALELFYTENGSYPASTLNPLVSANLISAVPEPPAAGGGDSYQYAGLGPGCAAYHIGILLENTEHKALERDADAAADPAGSFACNGGANDFDGRLPGVYDLVP